MLNKRVYNDNLLFFQSKKGIVCVQIIYLCTTNLIEMLKTILITLLIVAICIALLSVKILFKKNGRFPNTHVSGSKALRKKGIGCVQSQDREAQKINPHSISERAKSTGEDE